MVRREGGAAGKQPRHPLGGDDLWPASLVSRPAKPIVPWGLLPRARPAASRRRLCPAGAHRALCVRCAKTPPTAHGSPTHRHSTAHPQPLCERLHGLWAQGRDSTDRFALGHLCPFVRAMKLCGGVCMCSGLHCICLRPSRLDRGSNTGEPVMPRKVGKAVWEAVDS